MSDQSRPVHELFEDFVARTPDATAVLSFAGPSFSGLSSAGRLTYADLDARANRLAHLLAERGVGPDVMVGLCLRRSAEMVVAILAVSKAGGAYLPIDPDYPADRLAFMLADSGASVVVTQRDVRHDFDGYTVVVETDAAVRPSTKPDVAVAPGNLLYAMYTSGSTGTPKGVLVEHRSVPRLVLDPGYVHIGPSDVVAQFASISFDAATFEIWGALLNGAQLALAPPGVLSAEELARFLSRSGTTVLWLTAGMFHEVVDADVSMLSGLRWLLAGGDVLSPSHCAKVRANCPGTRLVNGYGPTEGTTFTACHQIKDIPDTVIPIGRPVRETFVHVLDEAMRPATTGELYIGGEGLARGYLNRPGLTAHRFVAAPGGERLYRSGDLVRLSETGELEFLGRADDQVKIRGFRVEPGEIESALRTHPDVLDVVVVARKSDSGDKRLVAYVVSDGEPPLRDYLADRLPAYLVPAAFVRMDRLPLNSNGKVDRHALPAPVDVVAGRGESGGDPVIRTVTRVWAEVLGVPGVGPEDDFFALGGDSLLAVRALSRIYSALGVALPAKALFDAPVAAAFADAVRACSVEDTTDIEPVQGDTAPLSFAQSRFWFAHEFQSEALEYNVSVGFRLSGAPDIDALRAAVWALAARHEALRTTFTTDETGPVQVIHPDMTVDLTIVRADDDLETVLRGEVSRPFDLMTGPLARIVLVSTTEQDHVLLLCLHHAVTDGWSIGLLAKDLSGLYRGARLEPLAVRYRDFAVWQRAHWSGNALDAQLRYWRERLDGVTPLELPCDRPRPAVRTSSGTAHRFVIPVEVADGLREFSRRNGVSLFMTLVAVCQVMFARYSGQRDVAVGTVVSGRNRVELEQLAGCFINTLVLRSDVDPGRSFTDFLGAVRETVLGAFANQDVPFERLVDDLRPDRDPSRTPLIQAMVVLQNAEMAPPVLEGVHAEEIDLPHVSAIFDIGVEFTERDGALRVMLEYNTDLFDTTTIERMARHLQVLLASAPADGHRPVGDLPMLTEAERHQVVVAWNDTTVDVVEDQCVHELFAEQALRAPDAVALEYDNAVLTFAELDDRANRLAHHLVTRGVGPDVPVALCVERGFDMVIGMLGVLKAGGAYVPLDPAHPADRIDFVLRDTAAPILLTHRPVVDRLVGVAAEVISLDDDWPAISRMPGTAPVTTVTPRRLAYIVYTSGSTGTPKGVMIEHRSLVNLCTWYRGHYQVTTADRASQLVTPAFDPVALEVWGNLCAGASVAIAPEKALDDPADLVRWFADVAVTIAVVPAPRLDAVLDQFGSTRTRIRAMITGADVVRRRPAPEWGLRLVNHYGPTETTVLATGADVADAGQAAPGTLPPIGAPVSNTTAYVLDPRGKPVPVGVAGELHIGGAGVARGYVNRPELTAQRFVPDVFGGRPGGRLYRTGDLVRWQPDGNLEFLGRIDHQVKIRGHRVEPGEIETALLAHPDVTEAVVAAREDTPGRKRLVGYVVLGENRPNETDIRDFLARSLPEYMVPAAFVVMPEFPLTTTGKVDRHRLPAPEPGSSPDEYRAPGSAVARTLATIWADVLGVAQVGAKDNFFALGGDSILSIQVVTRARQAGLAMTSKQLFLHQTVEALAAQVTQTGQTAPAAGADEPVAGTAPTSPIQRLYFEQFDTRQPFNQFVLADLADDVDAAALRTAISGLITQHDALRTRFTMADGHWQQEIELPDDHDPLTLVDVSLLDDEAVDLVIRRMHATVDIHDGPLIKAVLLATRRGPRLLLTAHHLVVDGVSWRILLDDLRTGYRQASQGEPVDLGRKTSSSLDWSRALAGHVGSGGLDDERDYWAEATAGVETALLVDNDGRNSVETTRRLRCQLDENTTQALLSTEINTVLVAALGRVLSAWTGRDRVLLGMEGHGREDIFDDIDLTRTVGWFTTYFPLALHVSHEDWDGLIESAGRQMRAVPGKGLGYGALKYYGDAFADTPAPLVSFNYLGRFDSDQPGGDLYRRVSEIGLYQAPTADRAHLLDVVGLVKDGKLEFSWFYSSEIHQTATIEHLADEFADALVRIAGRTPADLPATGLDDQSIVDVYPLTPAQRGMLFDALLAPESGVYVGQFDIGLTGVDDPARLGEAWQRVVDRTPVLRTSVVWQEIDDALQVVRRDVRLPISHHDLTGLSASGQLREYQRLLKADRGAGVDLSSPSPTRLTLARISDTEVRAIWTVHHLMLDGWSAHLLLADVLAAYSGNALRAQRPFRDYVTWLLDQDSAEAESYWRDELAGFTAPTPLCYDKVPAQEYVPRSTAVMDWEVPAQVTARLAAFAKRAGLTVNTLVQGAWALLLAAHSGERDVCFGATVSGRPADVPDVESIAGLFITTLPVRVDVDGVRDLKSWLSDLQQAQARARSFESVSLPQVQGWSELPAGTRLFDSIVVFENYPVSAQSGEGARLRDLSATEVNGYPLNLVVYPGERMSFAVRYDPALFRTATARRIAGQLTALLESFVDSQTVRDTTMLSPSERDRTLVQWNDTATELLSGDSVPALFEQQATRTPDAVALVTDAGEVTYRDLNASANKLARHLADLGVGRESRVALFMDRSADAVMALLAVLKAGAAYVPLHASYPAERIRWVVEDTAAMVLVTDKTVDTPGCPVVRVDDQEAWEHNSSADLPVEVDARQLAYVMYTSGSTGIPKGVAVTHHNIVCLVSDRRWRSGAHQRILFHSPHAFDAATYEMWVPLLTGGQVVIAAGEVDARELRRLVADHGVTAAFLTTALFTVFAEELPDCFAGLRELWTGGEAASLDAFGRAMAGCPDTTMVHVYGPTESTTFATCAPMTVEHLASGATPIGSAMDNTRLYVLDRFLNPVAPGVPGELYIAGDGLARGYFGRPGLTAERFIADPHGSGSRLYRTGDLVRWQDDGLLEFLGRADDQVKIRGFRIETGEIENALRAHQDVGAAVVVVRQAKSGSKQLVAYVVPGQDCAPPAADELARRLGQRLPDYMIPTAFVIIDKIPLNANGKVARDALPEPSGGAQPGTEHVEPRNATEEALARIWAELLGTDRVGVHDNFFHAGGDSIVTLRLLSRVRRAFGVDVSPREFFDSPTIGALALTVRDKVLAELVQA
nr:AMP-dependent synthetase and ligase [uncultured bacterium]